MSFYLTYRPQTIAEIDNISIRETLSTWLDKSVSDLPHAFLFSGPKGTGKTTAARLVAKIFNCEKRKKSVPPCGKCPACSAIARGNALDVIELDGASNRGIDDIRTLKEGIYTAPSSLAYKVYIIDEVHMLTNEAFNALLKILEEPPKHAVFVLATTDPQKVPPTILSRAIHLRFHAADTEELLAALKRISDAEKIQIADDARLEIIKAADGSFRDAVKLLEQVSFHKLPLTADVVRSLVHSSSGQIVVELLKFVSTQDLKGAINLLESQASLGTDMKAFLTDTVRQLHQELVARTLGSGALAWLPQDLLETALKRFESAFAELKLTPVPQLPLELAIIDLCSSPSSSPAPIPPVSPAPILPSSPKLPKSSHPAASPDPEPDPDGLLTIEKLTEHWPDFITACKPINHSIAGVLRSARPKSVVRGIVTIEAFYKFHQERLSEIKTKEALSDILKKLFGVKVKIEVVLGKK